MIFDYKKYHVSSFETIVEIRICELLLIIMENKVLFVYDKGNTNQITFRKENDLNKAINYYE